mmetsp:Transcript_8154/g.23267  ORF Transcript_8154/g.23267 Transcript_8154/m.23267 type:complete len:227 (+) Transcript_8154:406-1086(+)
MSLSASCITRVNSFCSDEAKKCCRISSLRSLRNLTSALYSLVASSTVLCSSRTRASFFSTFVLCSFLALLRSVMCFLSLSTASFSASSVFLVAVFASTSRRISVSFSSCLARSFFSILSSAREKSSSWLLNTIPCCSIAFNCFRVYSCCCSALFQCRSSTTIEPWASAISLSNVAIVSCNFCISLVLSAPRLPCECKLSLWLFLAIRASSSRSRATTSCSCRTETI